MSEPEQSKDLDKDGPSLAKAGDQSARQARLNYEGIVSALSLAPGYMDHHREIIVERLYEAAFLIHAGRDSTRADRFNTHTVVAVNQCIHLASSVALIGSSTEGIDAAKNQVAKLFGKAHVDATTVITMAMLAHILREAIRCSWRCQPPRTQPTGDRSRDSVSPPSSRMSSFPPPEMLADGSNPRAFVELIQSQLDRVNWMIGPKEKAVLFELEPG